MQSEQPNFKQRGKALVALFQGYEIKIKPEGRWLFAGYEWETRGPEGAIMDAGRASCRRVARMLSTSNLHRIIALCKSIGESAVQLARKEARRGTHCDE